MVGLGLHALQHRGQESSGIVSCDERGEFHTHKGIGLVSDVYDDEILAGLPGVLAIGHNRYSTTGSLTLENTQPLRVVYRGGPLALAHNGNLVNARELRQGLEGSGSIFQTTLDTEIFLHLIALSSTDTVEEALVEAARQVRGAYSMVVLTREAVLALRDPHGFRPLCIGRLGDGYVVASETCALDLVAAEFVREVEPGELVRIDPQGMRVKRVLPAADPPRHCVFEHIYFSRPDSRVFGDTVDRIQFVTEPFAGFYLAPMLDFDVEGPSSERDDQGQSGVADGSLHPAETEDDPPFELPDHSCARGERAQSGNDDRAYDHADDEHHGDLLIDFAGSQNGDRPLHQAARFGRTEIAARLIARGADAAIFDKVVDFLHTRFQEEIKLDSFSLKDIKFDPQKGLENLADLRRMDISLRELSQNFHVPKEWIEKYRGVFDHGWDALREQVLERQKELGVVPPETELTVRPSEIPGWGEMPDELKPILARQMEVFAGYLEHAETVSGWTLRPRVIAIEITWSVDTRDEYWQVRQELTNFLRPNLGGDVILRHTRADGGAECVAQGALRSRLLAELVQELLPCDGGVRRRDDCGHTVRFAAGGQPNGVWCRFSGIRSPAPHSAACMGAGLDHLLADAGAFHHLCHLSRCVLHHRHQRGWRRQVDRRSLLPGRAVDGFEQLGYFPPHHPAWNVALHLGGLRSRHWDHVGSSRRG